jgi:hypothetical protein
VVWVNTDAPDPPDVKNATVVALEPYATPCCVGAGNEMLPVSVRVFPPPVNVILEPVTVIVLSVLVEPTSEKPSEFSVKSAEPVTVPDVLTENVG